MTKLLDREQCRILIAAQDGRLSINKYGRYVIASEERPERKARERLQKRRLLIHLKGDEWFVPERGARLLRESMASAVVEARAEQA